MSDSRNRWEAEAVFTPVLERPICHMCGCEIRAEFCVKCFDDSFRHQLGDCPASGGDGK